MEKVDEEDGGDKETSVQELVEEREYGKEVFLRSTEKAQHTQLCSFLC